MNCKQPLDSNGCKFMVEFPGGGICSKKDVFDLLKCLYSYYKNHNHKLCPNREF